jgi:hypothetical protein
VPSDGERPVRCSVAIPRPSQAADPAALAPADAAPLAVPAVEKAPSGWDLLSQGWGLLPTWTPVSPNQVDGLTLGRGSWASAYREASGLRLNSMRLLCACGIVTARELEDDLTVIDEDHIDECIFIATEMLGMQQLAQWKDQPAEAKRVFEERLTALYRHRQRVSD